MKLIDEARHLSEAGNSYREIAEALNAKHGMNLKPEKIGRWKRAGWKSVEATEAAPEVPTAPPPQVSSEAFVRNMRRSLSAARRPARDVMGNEPAPTVHQDTVWQAHHGTPEERARASAAIDRAMRRRRGRVI